MKYSIIIPVYNEENTIKFIIEKVKKVAYPGTKEIIVIDDGSTDNSINIIKKIKGIIIIHNTQNRGKGYALRKGFNRASGDIVLIQDADLEYEPQEHLKLISKLKENKADVVYGSRFLKKSHNYKVRYKVFYLGNIMLSFLTQLLYAKKITDMETCYKVFKRSILKDLKLTANRFDFEPEITGKLLKSGIDIIEVPISYNSRSYQEGKKIGAKDGVKAIWVLVKVRFFL